MTEEMTICRNSLLDAYEALRKRMEEALRENSIERVNDTVGGVQ